MLVPRTVSRHAARLLLLLLAGISLLPAALPGLLAQELQGAEHRPGGEVNLRLPDLNQGDFLGFTGHQILLSGLVVCGLTVAGFRSLRARRVPPPPEEALHLDLLRTVAEHLSSREPATEALAVSLQDVVRVLPLVGVAVRSAAGARIASQGLVATAPEELLQGNAWHTVDEEGPRVVGPMLPLPAGGARLPLQFRERQVGWLEVWGNGAPASADARRMLVDVGRLIAAVLSR